MEHLNEKVRALNGKDDWRTYDNLFPQIVFSDGPTGLRYQEQDGDHLGINESKKATCFPTLSALSCSWNKDLVKRVSAAIAEEAVEQGVDVVLAPGINIKRTPLCGRNFEYFSEDPYLTSELGIQYVLGLQENGVGASLKHFAGNNQEAYRMSVDAIIDKRALEEIYLYAFQRVIQKAKPWTVMAAYNKLLGEHCCQNKWLLTQTLREKWGYDGLVISDWFAVNDIVESIKNGLDLEMPSVGEYSYELLTSAIKQGEISSSDIERAFNNLLKLRERCDNKLKKSISVVDYKAHHELAREAAKDCIVLLKNENQVLPITSMLKVLFVGSLMETPNYQGNGSSKVNAMYVDSIFEHLDEQICYLPGYQKTSSEIDNEMVQEVVNQAKNAEKIVLFVGLLAQDEAEGCDRENLMLPLCQRHLMECLIPLKKPLVLVLQSGSAIELPWLDEISGLIQTNFSGQGMGKAIAEVLTGKSNPGGKLTETYPKQLVDTPAYLSRGDEKKVEYHESIFVGYRYYDKKEIDVLFPFGFGLSYSTFAYTAFHMEANEQCITICCNITNTSEVDGTEIVQIYVGLNEAEQIQPIKQLKHFQKVFIKAKDTYKFSCELSRDDFSYFDTKIDSWVVAAGRNTVYLGQSSRDIMYQQEVAFKVEDHRYPTITTDTTIKELMKIPIINRFMQQAIELMLQQQNIKPEELEQNKELQNNITFMPLRNIPQVSKGMVTKKQVDYLIKILNAAIGSKDIGLKSKLARIKLSSIALILKKLVS